MVHSQNKNLAPAGSMRDPEERRSRLGLLTVAAAGAMVLSASLVTGDASAAPFAPPSAGAIQKQLETRTPLPAPPGQVIALPRPKLQKSKSRIQIPIRSIVIEGNTLLPTQRLHALVRSAEGHSLPLGQLQALVDRITNAYHADGYPLAYAYLPAQRISNGVIHVAVVEPTYDAVRVSGRSRLKPGVARRTVGVTPGTPISQAPLERGLLLLSRTPGVSAHAVFTPGSKPRTSTLQIQVADTPLVSGSAFVNNSGNRSTGSILAGVEARVNNPFGYGSSFAVNGMASPWDTARLFAGGIAADSPYIWNGLRVGAYASSTVYHLGGSFAALDESGRAVQAGFDTTYPLVLLPGKALFARIDLLQNWLGQSVQASATSSDQSIFIERASLNGTFVDHLGGINQGNISVSHGDLAISPAAARTIDAEGPNAAGSFAVFVLELSRQQRLPRGFTLLGSLSGQLSSRNLDSSQKFYLGGPRGVASYAVGDGGGDDGYLAELVLSHWLPIPRLPGALVGSVLGQVGGVRVNHTPYPGATGPNDLTEAGLGGQLAYTWRQWSATVSYEHRIGSYASAGAATNRGDEAWFSIGRSF